MAAILRVRQGLQAARIARPLAANFSDQAGSLDWNYVMNYFGDAKTKKSLADLRKTHGLTKAALSEYSATPTKGLAPIDWKMWDDAFVLDSMRNIELNGKKTSVVQYLKENYEQLDKRIAEDEERRKSLFTAEVEAFEKMKTSAVESFKQAETKMRSTIASLESDIAYIEETANRFPDGYENVEEFLDRYPPEVHEKLQWHVDNNHWDVIFSKEVPLDKYDKQWAAYKASKA
eukprot:Rmarinus@m.26003